MSAVQELRAKAAELRAKADETEQLANQVEAALGGSSVTPVKKAGSTTAVSTGSGKRGRPKGSKNKDKGASAEGAEASSDTPAKPKRLVLKNVILDVLKENKGGLDLGAIVTKCLEKGYKTTVSHEAFGGIVYQNLHHLLKSNEINKEEERKEEGGRAVKIYKLPKAA